MPQTRHGLTIPAYSDIADGPGAFEDFVDNGTVPRYTSFSGLVAGWASPNDGSVCVVTADERYSIAPSPLNLLIYQSGKWFAMVPRRWNIPASAAQNVGNAGNTPVTILTGQIKADDQALISIDGAVTIDLAQVNDATRDWIIKTEYSTNGGGAWTAITNNTVKFFSASPASAPGASCIPIAGQVRLGNVSAAGKNPQNTVDLRITVQALRTIGAPEAQSVVAGTWLNVMTTVAGGWI